MNKTFLVYIAGLVGMGGCSTVGPRQEPAPGVDRRQPASFLSFRSCRPTLVANSVPPDALLAQLRMWSTLYGPVSHSITYVREAVYADTKSSTDPGNAEEPRVRLALAILDKGLKSVFEYAPDERAAIERSIWEQYRDRKDLAGYAFVLRGRLSLPFEEALERITTAAEAVVTEAASTPPKLPNVTHFLQKLQREVESLRDYAAEASGGDRDIARLGIGLRPAVEKLLNDAYASSAEYLGTVCK